MNLHFDNKKTQNNNKIIFIQLKKEKHTAPSDDEQQ